MANKSKKIIRKIDRDKLYSRIPPLPDDIDSWVHNTLFANDGNNYFFTQTRHGKKTGICTHCQAESQVYPYSGRKITPEDIEFAQAKHNDCGICPKCGTTVQFKDNGRGRKTLNDYGYFFILQPVKYGGIVIRSFYCCRKWGDVNLFADNTLPNIQYSEHFRLYFHNQYQVCLRYYNWYWGAIDYPCNEGKYWGTVGKIVKPSPHYGNTYFNTVFTVATYRPENWSNIIAKTEYKYSCLDKLCDRPELAGKYLELYSKNPILVERMMKQGFAKLLTDKLIYDLPTKGIINFNKNTVAEALNLSKAAIAKLPKDFTLRDIKVATIVEQNKCSAQTQSNISGLSLKELNTLSAIIKKVKPYTINNIFKYIRKQANVRNRNSAKYQYVIANTLSDYKDYINQVMYLKMQCNEGTLFPQSLQQAHTQLTALIAEIKAKKELAQFEELDASFYPKYKKLCKKYCYENGVFFVRPARGKQELYVEGTTLKHCVYTNYSDRYIAGKVMILLVRKQDCPDTPFYTLEIDPIKKVLIQCRTIHNASYSCDPAVKKFVDEYINVLQSTNKNHHTAA
ncbi:PcfJ domain-containing protein [Oscillospiraceae bacterium LCP25S3_E4]